MKTHFQPDINILLDAITRRKIPERIPNYEPYYNYKTVVKVTGREFTNDPFAERNDCRKFLKTLIEYQLTIGCDFIYIGLGGPLLPMKRDKARTQKEKNEYLTQRDLPTIVNRDDYRKYPWPDETKMGLSSADKVLLETAAKMVPAGMGILASRCGIYEVMNYFLGYENFCYLLADDPALIDEIAVRIAEINLRVFTEAAEYPFINIFHMGDDFAFRGGTLVAPELLRKWLFPWMKKYAGIAHAAGKVFTLHCDGNFKAVAEDIVKAGVDGKQAFEDVSYKVTDFKRDFGRRISVLGGIDVDKLTRLPEEELRKYVREVLKVCAPGGGYAIGSGNTFAPYIPLNNYLAMLDEARSYRG